MRPLLRLLLGFGLLIGSLEARAIRRGLPALDTAGPVTARIECTDQIADVEVPFDVSVIIENAGTEPIQGGVRLGVLTPWRTEPAEPAAFQAAPRECTSVAFRVIAGHGTYCAHYPIHAYVDFKAGGADLEAHPVRVVEAKPAGIPSTPPTPPTPPRATGSSTNSPARNPETAPPCGLKTECAGTCGTWRVEVLPGRLGLLDSAVQISGPEGQLAFNGIRVRVLDANLEEEASPIPLTAVSYEGEPGKCRARHRFQTDMGPFDLLIEIRPDNEALKIQVWLENTPQPQPWRPVYIQRVALGTWSRPADRVYSGQGNVIVKPRVFTPGFEGHRLATSFAGADFEGGPALLLGVDVPPDVLNVTPRQHTFTFETPHGQTITLIPCRDVWEGVRVWRGLDSRTTAGGVAKLAGRFAFDIWGGTFADGAAGLERAFRYGLTDAVVIWHNWQRWGYDCRLPDILPPNAQLGTPQEFARLAQVCADCGALFAPHDNYIDFYPDTAGFSYDEIAFNPDGEPCKAWAIGPGGQSYRWRADRFRPRLEANVTAVKEAFAPTAYFVDVWSSRAPYDFFTGDGVFFDRLFTRQEIGQSLAWIRDTLGGAPTISESGHDQLIGWLDGGQTNHMRIAHTAEPADRTFVTRVVCEDAERIPWFDAAYHDRFVGLGVGYGARYAGGLDYAAHGPYSDDYMATEALTGHPAMVDAPFGRDVVRKYWLMHDLARSIALRSIESVEFVHGDIHRQRVRWDNGGEVCVNRGESDWACEGHVLPPYGFYARIPGAPNAGEQASREASFAENAIERKAGRTVEWAAHAAALYVNPRPSAGADGPISFGAIESDGACRLTPQENGILLTPLPGEREFTTIIDWRALPWKLPPPKGIQTLAEDGTVLAQSEAPADSARVAIRCAPGVFAYALRGE